MKVKMKGRLLLLMAVFAITGCVKETYDMDRLSKKVHLSPTWGMSAVKGDISLEDILEPNDTIVFDENNFVRLVFKKDSVIDFKLSDFYDLEDMVSFSKYYTLGEMSIAPFTGTIAFPINQISSRFSPPVTYSTGTYPGFPSFPQIDIGEQSYTPFPNFESATFSEGTIDIVVNNNLPVTLGGLTLRLFNTATHTQIGNDMPVSSISSGGTGIGSFNLKDRTIPNSISFGAILHATTGTVSPVQIDLNTTNIEITVSGRNMKVRSGRVILPAQTITSLDGSDTMDFDPGSGIEIDIIKIATGNLSYTLKGDCPLKSTMSITLPSGLRNGVPITESLTVSPYSSLSGAISMTNSTIDLGTFASKPYNTVPVNYSIEVSSDGSMVTFDSNDEITLDLKLLNPEFDYVKGYFGQESKSIDADSLDLEIKDILSHISGEFLVSSPSIKLNYSNSFAIPIKIELKATGIRGSKKVDLGLSPFILSYPAAPAERDKSAVLTIDKTNSALPALISLPPEKVRFSGSAMMNPDGNTGARDNYIFNKSRFFGSLEVEVPLEFRLSNLQFSDTVDNFMKDEGSDNENGFNPDDFEYLKILFNAENGFPVGISLSMSLYDPGTGTIKSTINADKILEPALVDSNGKVTEPTKTETPIEITSEFWNSVSKADKIIFKFTVNTTGSDLLKDVKIYSDYSINFNAAVVLKADLKFQ
jgi:hypothetical protein